MSTRATDPADRSPSLRPQPASRIPRGLALPVLITGAILLGLAPTAVNAQATFATAPTDAPDPAVVAPLLETSKVEIQALDFLHFTDSGELLVELIIGTQPYTLSLFPHSLRGDEFRVLVDDGSGNLTEVPAPPIRTRRGTVLEIAGSRVAATFDGERLSAQIQTPNGSIGIQPVSDVIPGTDPMWHAVYAGRDVLPINGTCGTTGTGTIGGGPTLGGPMPLGGTTFNQTDIAIDCDFEFFQDNGSSVTATVNESEFILNGMGLAYDDSPILIVYELTTIVVRTSVADPYGSLSDSAALLDLFESVWNSGDEDGIQRDVAHLFSGVNFDGTVIGRANISDICTNFAYGINWASFSNNNTSLFALIAHELGHNWSSTHCNGAGGDCRIMCDTLGGCDGVNPLLFAPSRANQIVNYRNSRTCLSLRPPAQSIPFIDEFTTTALSTARWTYNRGGVVSSQGVGEPSGTLSFNIDSNGGGLYADDELRSNRILLAGVNDAHASFWVQHRGVESGESLIVEYQNSNLDWAPITSFTSDGVDETSYTFHEVFLPPNARHDNFRLRFRTEGNSATDDWFIDDVRVGSGPVTPPAPPNLIGITPMSGPLQGGTAVTVIGTDFQDNAAITIGGALLQTIDVVDDTTITGVIPPGAVAGFVTVGINQPSGNDALVSGFQYTENIIRHEDGAGAPGGLTTVPVIADHDDILKGWSLAVEFDPSLIEIVSISDAQGADFFQPSFDNSIGVGGGWWTVGCVLDLANIETIPPATDTVLALAEYQIAATLPLGIPIPVTPLDGVGLPATDNVLVDLVGNSLPAFLEGGTIVTEGVLFVRADVNDDGSINIADPIAVLDYLFSSAPASCLDALDGNDDGSVNIADAIFILDFLFSGGSPPPAPHPNPGTDPTADSLDCS